MSSNWPPASGLDPDNPYSSSTASGVPPSGPTPDGDPNQDGMAIASLVLGCVGLFGWCIACVGFAIGVAGIITGVRGLNSTKRPLAIVGICLSGLCLLLSVANMILGVLLVLAS